MRAPEACHAGLATGGITQRMERETTKTNKTMIYISKGRSKQSPIDAHIYTNGAATYLQFTLVDGNGSSGAFRVVLPKCLPVSALRTVRDYAVAVIGQNSLKWTFAEAQKLQLAAREGLRKAAMDYLESQRLEKI
jgi:hypothetical protein